LGKLHKIGRGILEKKQKNCNFPQITTFSQINPVNLGKKFIALFSNVFLRFLSKNHLTAKGNI